MTKPFKLLREKMAPEARERASRRANEMLQELDLQELRQKGAAVSQEGVAQVLGVKQPAVSKMEHSDDMLVSTLYQYVHALGGELEIQARVMGRNVRLTQFDHIATELRKKLVGT